MNREFLSFISFYIVSFLCVSRVLGNLSVGTISNTSNLSCVAITSSSSIVSNTSCILNVNNNVYNEKNAFHHLYFAYGAYCDVKSLESWDCKWCKLVPGFEVETVVSNNNMLAFVGFDQLRNEIIVSFRGSHNIPNWIDDFDTISISYPGVKNGEVHRGVYQSWLEDLYPYVMPAVKSIMNRKKEVNVVVSGHSLGGALAQVAALAIYDYAKQINNNIEIICYTYGSIRWGNRVMANYFNERIKINWRLMHKKDIAPDFPTKFHGYYHTTTGIWYTDDDPLTYKQCSSTDGDSDCDYVGYSISSHLRYLNVYESCDDS